MTLLLLHSTSCILAGCCMCAKPATMPAFAPNSCCCLGLCSLSWSPKHWLALAAGAYPAHLLLSTELQGVSSAGVTQMASLMQVSAQVPAAAFSQAVQASAQLYTGSTLGEIQASGLHALVLWFSFRPGWRTFDSETLVAWGGR